MVGYTLYTRGYGGGTPCTPVGMGGYPVYTTWVWEDTLYIPPGYTPGYTLPGIHHPMYTTLGIPAHTPVSWCTAVHVRAGVRCREKEPWAL